MGSKGKGGRIRLPPSSGPTMMKQVQQLQAQMLQVQDQLAQETVSASAGGGAVTIAIDGQQQIRAVTIDPDVVRAEDVEMLQDLIVAAVNEALRRSRELAEQRMAPLTGALNLPGLI